MLRGERMWERLAAGADLSEEPLPGQPIVEIAGCGRVLIEHHLGVAAYCRERIVVKMKFGFVHVCGSCLELSRMSREQLVIQGQIEGVSLQRRG